MTADVAEDATVFRPLKEPCRTAGLVKPVRTETQHLDDSANAALLDKITCKHRGFRVQSLAVINHELPARARDCGARGGKLLQRSKRSLVGEVVLAGIEHAT